MIRKRQEIEAAGVLDVVLDALLATVASRSLATASALVYSVGQLRANAATLIHDHSAGASLSTCFDSARIAGATLQAMASVRLQAMAQTPISGPAKAIATGAVRLSLAQEARILGATTFVSRDDVDAAIVAYDTAFEDAQDYAAANSEADVYAALVTVHAALMNDLTTRSRPLPLLTTYAFGRVYSAIGLAHRLYGDASRAEQLVAENKVVNPGFMPLSGTALSV